jgi:CBS domain-containing protein
MLPVQRTIVPHVLHDQTIVTLKPDVTVREAAKQMGEKRIGAFPVVEKGKLVGIFSERDVVNRVVAPGRDPNKTSVGDVMTPNPDTIGPNDSVADALELMSKKGYRHLPVLEDGRLLGIISIRDLYRSVRQQMESDILLLAETLIRG